MQGWSCSCFWALTLLYLGVFTLRTGTTWMLPENWGEIFCFAYVPVPLPSPPPQVQSCTQGVLTLLGLDNCSLVFVKLETFLLGLGPVDLGAD